MTATGTRKRAPKKVAKKKLAKKRAYQSTTDRGRGRPVGGDAFQPEYPRMIGVMAKAGMIDTEIADALGVSVRTLHTWKHRHPEILPELRLGKRAANDRAERALFQRAVGYEYDAVKIHVSAETGMVTKVPYREHVPPDPSALRYYLDNRRARRWKSKVNHAVGGDPDNPTPVGIVLIPPKEPA